MMMISIYWAADVFNLSDMCWGIFNYKFINQENLQVSLFKLTVIISLWFLFRWISRTVLSLMRLHFETKDPSSAESCIVAHIGIHTPDQWRHHTCQDRDDHLEDQHHPEASGRAGNEVEEYAQKTDVDLISVHQSE